LYIVDILLNYLEYIQKELVLMKISDNGTSLVHAAIPQTTIYTDVVLALGFACLTAASAQVSFWIGPVPVSGQTFAVLLAGAVLGSRLGALSQLSYLLIGLTGIPFWFSMGGVPGIARLIGPTGGYLLGFIACAYVVGLLVERGWGKNVFKAVVAMILGSMVMYICGLSWLSHYVSDSLLLQTGLYPFVVGDAIKIVAAAMLIPSGWMLLRRINS
jgi:biotin transporter BioY